MTRESRPVRPFFRPLDAVVLAVLAVAAFLPLLTARGEATGATVVVSGPSGIVATVPLTGDRTLRVAGPLGDTVIQIREGSARILSSPCPERFCMEGGALMRPGQSAVCLPNLVAVTIRGEAGDDDLDAVSR